jgi:hypothetical protein
LASATRSHGIAYDRKCLFARLPVGHDVVGAVEVAAVDFGDRDELVDVERVGALDLNGFDLLGLYLDILTLGNLVAAALVVLVDDLAADLIYHLLAQAMAGLAVDLVEVGLLGLARGGVEADGAARRSSMRIGTCRTRRPVIEG